MTIVTVNRVTGTTFNPDNIPSNIVDILDELFYRKEWDFSILTFVVEYKDNICYIKNIIANSEYSIDKDTVELAYDILSDSFKQYINISQYNGTSK